MLIIEKDITTVDKGIIAHQVNCTNHIGSGVAKALISEYPMIKPLYHDWCYGKSKEDLLGSVQMISVSDELYIANCFSQLDKGYDGKLYTDYNAISTCFSTLREMNKTAFMTQIYIPFKYGCGLGGGSWDVVSTIIDVSCPGVIACRI